MEFFRIQKDIPFMRHALKFNIISIVTFLLAVFFLITKGLHFSVEFTGGTLVEVRYEESAPLDKIRSALADAQFKDFVVQNVGSSHDVMIRLPLFELEESPEAPNDANAAQNKIADSVMRALNAATEGAHLQRIEFVGPQVGKELTENGALALLVVLAGIMIYLALRFEWRFALATIIANFHDVVIILGFFAFCQWEFSLSVLAAVLSVLGYSVNESVVVFDRVRETFRKARQLSTTQVVDHAITQNISRTIITHGSTQMMVLSMFFFGGETLHYFSLALTVGICFGIYSSVFVASPVAVWLGVTRAQFIVKPKKDDPFDGACV